MGALKSSTKEKLLKEIKEECLSNDSVIQECWLEKNSPDSSKMATAHVIFKRNKQLYKTTFRYTGKLTEKAKDVRIL